VKFSSGIHTNNVLPSKSVNFNRDDTMNTENGPIFALFGESPSMMGSACMHVH